MTKGEQALADAIRRAIRAARANRMPRYVLALPDGRYRQLRDMGIPRLGDGVRLVALVYEDGSVSADKGEARAARSVRRLGKTGEEKMEKKSMAVACMAFFGKKTPDQTLPQFSDELKQLTQKDRNELAEMFKTINVEIIPLVGHTEV